MRICGNYTLTLSRTHTEYTIPFTTIYFRKFVHTDNFSHIQTTMPRTTKRECVVHHHHHHHIEVMTKNEDKQRHHNDNVTATRPDRRRNLLRQSVYRQTLDQVKTLFCRVITTSLRDIDRIQCEIAQRESRFCVCFFVYSLFLIRFAVKCASLPYTYLLCEQDFWLNTRVYMVADWDCQAKSMCRGFWDFFYKASARPQTTPRVGSVVCDNLHIDICTLHRFSFTIF